MRLWISTKPFFAFFFPLFPLRLRKRVRTAKRNKIGRAGLSPMRQVSAQVRCGFFRIEVFWENNSRSGPAQRGASIIVYHARGVAACHRNAAGSRVYYLFPVIIPVPVQQILVRAEQERAGAAGGVEDF